MELILFWLNVAKYNLIRGYEQTWNNRNKTNCNDVEIESTESHIHCFKPINLLYEKWDIVIKGRVIIHGSFSFILYISLYKSKCHFGVMSSQIYMAQS